MSFDVAAILAEGFEQETDCPAFAAFNCVVKRVLARIEEFAAFILDDLLNFWVPLGISINRQRCYLKIFSCQIDHAFVAMKRIDDLRHFQFVMRHMYYFRYAATPELFGNGVSSETVLGSG